MATLGVYDEIAKKYVDKETIALEIIPELWKLSLMPTLNVSQFKKYMAVIKEVSSKIEEQHLRHLEGLKSLDDGQGKEGFNFFFFFQKIKIKIKIFQVDNDKDLTQFQQIVGKKFLSPSKPGIYIFFFFH